MTQAAEPPVAVTRAPRYRALLQVREYRALVAADVFSLLGDQLAAVALAVLIYQRTGSALLAALGYATTYAPWLLGGPMLAAIADRLPSRRVLVGIDLSRAVLIGLAAVPGMPLLVLGGLLLCSSMLSPPFRSARASLVPQVLPDDRYPLALSLQEALHQSSQLIGFVAGGALVAILSAHGALAVDSATFLVSAVVLLRGLTPRPPSLSKEKQTSLLRESVDGLRLVAGNPLLRRPLQLAMVGSMYVIVPEAIAPAYAARLGGGAVTVGLIMASVASGSLIGALVMGRWVPAALRQRVLYPVAIAGTLPLLATLLDPGLLTCLGLFTAAGACTAFQVPANAAFAAAVPPEARARAFGVAITGMMGAQLVGIVAGGAAAQVLAPSRVVAGAGLVGLLSLLAIVAEGGLRTARGRQCTEVLGPALGLEQLESTIA